MGKPILCNACGTRYRRTHQFKHASELVADGLPRSCSISSSLGTSSAAIIPSLESPGASLGTRSASISTRSGSFGTKASPMAQPSSQQPRKQLSQGSAGARNHRKRTLEALAHDGDLDVEPGTSGLK